MSNQTDKPRLCKKGKFCQVVSKSDTNISELQTKIAKQFTCDSNSQKGEGSVHNAKLSIEIGENKECETKTKTSDVLQSCQSAVDVSDVKDVDDSDLDLGYGGDGKAVRL